MIFKLSFLSRALGAMTIATFLAMAHPASAQDPLAIPGTTVTLSPIEGWTVAEGFSGLANQKTQSSAVVVELPGAAEEQVAPLFSSIDAARTAFASQGVEVKELRSLATDAGAEFSLVTGTQNAGGIPFDKWIALFKGASTVMLTVQAPQEAALDGSAVEAMLKSVVLADEVSMEEKLAALPFRIETSEPFRVVDTIAGSGLLMTAGPADIDPEGKQPVVIVAMQVSQPAAAGQQEQIAKALLTQTASLEQAQVEKTETVPFAGGEGVLLSGSAGDADMARRFVQYLRIGEEGRFVRLVAMAREAEFENVKSAVETIAASIDFRK